MTVSPWRRCSSFQWWSSWLVASATQSGDGSESILFPIVNADQGPVAAALIKVFRKHLDVREVTWASAEHAVADENDAPAALILPPASDAKGGFYSRP